MNISGTYTIPSTTGRFLIPRFRTERLQGKIRYARSLTEFGRKMFHLIFGKDSEP